MTKNLKTTILGITISVFIVGIFFGSYMVNSSTVFAQDFVPGWVKVVAGAWAEEQISDQEFINAVEFLIDEEVIQLPIAGPTAEVDGADQAAINDLWTAINNLQTQVNNIQVAPTVVAEPIDTDQAQIDELRTAVENLTSTVDSMETYIEWSGYDSIQDQIASLYVYTGLFEGLGKGLLQTQIDELRYWIITLHPDDPIHK